MESRACLTDACSLVYRGALPGNPSKGDDTMSRESARTTRGQHRFEIRFDASDDQAAVVAGRQLPNARAGISRCGKLLARLGTCTVSSLRRYAEHNRWPLEYLHVYLHYYRDADGARIDRRLSVGGLADWQKRRFAEIAECTPVSQALHAELCIRTTLV